MPTLFLHLIACLFLLYLTSNILLLLLINDSQYILYKYLTDLLYSASYIYLNFKLLNNYVWRQQTNSKTELFTIKWTAILMLLFVLTPLKYAYQIIYYLIDSSKLIDSNYQPLIGIGTIGVCVYILLNPNNFYNLNFNITQYNFAETETKIKLIWKTEIDEAIINKADQEIYKRISKRMKYYLGKVNNVEYENHILLKPDTKLEDLALQLQMPKSHLAFLFKYNCQISFIEYKKIIRIEKAKKLIVDDFLKFNTLNSLAKKVGFKSYDPFYKSFKEITSFGPMDYNINNNKLKNNVK